MKNTKNIVDEFVDKYLITEFNRIQQYTYLDLRLLPSEEQCKKEWESLSNTDKFWTYSYIVKLFHQSIVFANKDKQQSPYGKWEEIKTDIDKFKKLLVNRLTYNESFIKYGLPEDGIIPLHIYAQGINIMRWSPEVSYFKPALAKYLINKYLNEFDMIYDPFSGYSGRMLGALACGKEYCGSDISEMVINESQNIYNWLSASYDVPNVYLNVADVLDTHAEFDCLFTCSPYGIIEDWPDIELTNLSCDEWIDVCLKNCKCKRYLFVTDDKINKWKDNVVEVIENKSHFGKNVEYVVMVER